MLRLKCTSTLALGCFGFFGARTDIWMRGGSANLSAKVLKLKLSITKYEMTTK